LSIIQGPFSVAPCQTLASRFATVFVAVCRTPTAPSHGDGNRVALSLRWACVWQCRVSDHVHRLPPPFCNADGPLLALTHPGIRSSLKGFSAGEAAQLFAAHVQPSCAEDADVLHAIAPPAMGRRTPSSSTHERNERSGLRDVLIATPRAVQRWKSCDSKREGFRAGDRSLRPFRNARRLPSTRL
jgi:hypothetical protein